MFYKKNNSDVVVGLLSENKNTVTIKNVKTGHKGIMDKEAFEASYTKYDAAGAAPKDETPKDETPKDEAVGKEEEQKDAQIKPNNTNKK
jgi:hypothetical protein